MTATAPTRVSTVTPEDEEAVKSLLQQLMDGLNRGSGAGFATPFAENCQLIAFDGTHFRIRGEIAVFHQ